MNYCTLTLPCTVVSCKHAFSKLRLGKTRLRSLIGQELLESLLLCSVEIDFLKAIGSDTVRRKLSLKASEFRKLLIFVAYSTNHLENMCIVCSRN